MASIDSSRTGMRNPSGIADLIVKGAIALVTAAFFIGAYLQFQLSFWLALIAALSVYIALLMVHALMRRAERVDVLASEVSRLESELARAKGPDDITTAIRASQQHASVAAKAATVQRPSLSTSARPEPKMPGALPERASAEPARKNEPPPLGGLSPAAAKEPSAPKLGGSEESHDYWSFRPTKQSAPEAAPPRPAAEKLASATTPPPPPAPSLAVSRAEREADLEDVQGMIRRLADELNLGDDPLAEKPHPGAPLASAPADGLGLDPFALRPQEHFAPDHALRASVDALQSTADTMRAAAAKSKKAPPLGRGNPGGPASSPSMPPPIAPGHTRISAVAAAVAAGRMNVALKSIIGLADHQVHHHEVVLTPRDEIGTAMPLAAHEPQLAGTGLNPLIDTARLKRAGQICRSLTDAGQKGCVLSATSAESLSSERFMEEIANSYSDRAAVAGELVLSFGLAEVKAFDVNEWSALTDMRDLGFRFALEDVTDADYEFSTLTAAGFTYVKIDANEILRGLSGPRGAITSAADICRNLSSLGLTVVIDGIDDEATRSAIIECGVSLGAGPLFGPARVIIGDAASAAA